MQENIILMANRYTSVFMEREKLEFFKLDEIDRKVLLWLLDHVPQKSVVAWLDFIASEYWTGKSVRIDPGKLYSEVDQEESEPDHFQ